MFPHLIVSFTHRIFNKIRQKEITAEIREKGE